MSNWSFLGLNSGFWIIAFPMLVIWISGDLYIKERDANTLNLIEDFIDLDDIDESELYRMEFKISKEEKWKIGQVLKRAEYSTVDELIRSSLYEMIK